MLVKTYGGWGTRASTCTCALVRRRARPRRARFGPTGHGAS